MTVILLIIGLAALALYLFSVFSLLRFSLPLEPALTPGEIGQARDPEFFALQEQSFREGGFQAAGDFAWHDGLSGTVMRIFREISGESYGWAVEESVAGVAEAQRSVSVLTEFADGTLLDTTSRGETGLAAPSWFQRESMPLDTPILLRRHQERKAEAVRGGKRIVPVEESRLLEVVRRNERRLGEYQVEIGRMRLFQDRLRYSRRSAFWMAFKGLCQVLIRPFWSKRADR